MQEKTKLELELLEKEEYKKVLEEWSKLNSQIVQDGRFGSNYHIESLLKVGSEYIDRILNKYFETEESTLKVQISNSSESDFIDLQNEIIHILEKKCDLLYTDIFKGFQTAIESNRISNNKQTIYEKVGALFEEKKEIAINKIKLLRINIEEKISSIAQNAQTVVDLDSLTKLLMRRCFDYDLPRNIDEAKRLKRPVSLIMADIDHFKKVNDTYGHLKGDEVLAGVASCILSITENKGRCYRYGGEEIVIILNNYDIHESMAVAERIRRNLESEPISNVSVTASFGIGMFPDHGDNGREIIEAADKALYDAKNRGRNLVRIFGEPEPPKDKKREPERKLPSHGTLTEEEKKMLRRQYFMGVRIRCPKDQAILEVNEIKQIGTATADLYIWCKMCGLTGQL